MRHRRTLAILSTALVFVVLGSDSIASAGHRSRVAGGGLIAFTRCHEDRSRPCEVFTIRPEGDGLKMITFSATTESSLDGSPSGLAVAFGAGGIEIVGLDGSQRALTSANGARSPSWSPDGRWIAYYRNDSGCPSCPKGIFTLTVDGSKTKRLTRGRFFRDPDWSPDGTHLVLKRSFRGYAEVYVMEADGVPDPVPITEQGAYGVAHLQWALRGPHQIAFVGVGGGLPDPTVFVMRWGGDPVAVAQFTHLEGLSWSPDGTMLVAAAEVSGSAEGLFLIDVATAQVTLLTKLSGLRSVTWLPAPRDGCEILGSHRADGLLGTARSEKICGFDGSDSVRGQRGEDVFVGGSGSDILRDLEGHEDTLRGGGGADTLRSDDGKADSLRGGGGFDRCIGDSRDSFRSCEHMEIRGLSETHR